MSEAAERRENFRQYAQRESALELVRRSSQGLHLYVISALFVVFGSGILFDAALVSGTTSVLLGVVSLRRAYLADNFESAYARTGESAFWRFVILQYIQSVLWGVLASVIIGQYGLLSPQSTLTLLITMGFLAGGTHSLTARRYVHVLFLSCMTLPILPVFFSMNGAENLYLLGALFLFLYLLVIEGIKSNRSFVRLLLNQYQLIREQRKAHVANEAKSQFLANMSHEFRTPMNSVVALADLLMCDSLTPRQRQFTETIQSSAYALLQLINDILDFAKIEADQFEIESVDFNPGKLFDEVTELVARDATERGLEYVCFLDASVPQLLCGDPGRLRQVVINLVSNAIKFTDNGEVITRVFIGDIDKTGWDQPECELKVSVSDTGIGIEESKLENLFSAFDQVDASVTRRHGGSGLGLTISKRLVEMMDGSIEVESRVGVGSTFTFTVRLRESEISSTRETPQLRGSSDKPRILVVETNATSREWLRVKLEDGGYRPYLDGNLQTEPKSIVTSLRTAAKQGDPFQMAMVDADLIHHQFGKFTEQLRKHPLTEDVALIFMVRYGEVSESAEGWFNMISKPMTESALRRCFADQCSNDILPVEPLPKLSNWQKRVGRNLKHNRILVAEDNFANQRVAIAILEHAGYVADVVADGHLAIKALESRPYDLVLMDCSMPNMDGFSATRAIRAPDSSVLNSNIPIIAVTALAMKGDEQKCLDAGMDDYVCKPVNTASLIHKIEQCLDPVIRDILGEPNTASDTTDTTLASADLEATVMAVDELRELELMDSIIELFLEDAPNQISELQAAIQSMDCKKLGAINHKIRGSSSLLGVDLISNLTIAAENAARQGDFEKAAEPSRKVVAELQKLLAQMLESDAEKAMHG